MPASLSTVAPSAASAAPATSTAPTAPGLLGEIDPATVQRWLESGDCIVVDVREADEHRRESIPGTSHQALTRFDAPRACDGGARRVVFHCKSGRRSADAASRAALHAGSDVQVYTMTGGIEAWKAAGLPVLRARSAPALSVMQQTQLVIGLGVLAGTLLGAFVNPWFLVLPAGMGAGLCVAGLTGTCALARGIELLPWNRACGASCGSCSAA